MNAVPNTLRAAYPWQGKRIEVPGGTMHVLDEGPPDAPVIVAVHGNPTWSFYWRRLVAHYAGRYRVIAPDHLGCGLSDKPQGWSYRLKDHVDNLRRVLDALEVERATFAVHDWGGAIGMGVATADPGRAERFVVTNTGAWLSKAIPPSIATVKIPVFGTLAVRGLNGFARAAVLRATAKGLSPEARSGLLLPYGSWHDRIATLRFVQDIPLFPGHPSYAELERIDHGLAALAEHPMLICWGDADFCFTPRFRKEWERRFPNAIVRHWSDVGHYVMEDAPDRLLAEMDAFLEQDA